MGAALVVDMLPTGAPNLLLKAPVEAGGFDALLSYKPATSGMLTFVRAFVETGCTLLLFKRFPWRPPTFNKWASNQCDRATIR